MFIGNAQSDVPKLSTTSKPAATLHTPVQQLVRGPSLNHDGKGIYTSLLNSPFIQVITCSCLGEMDPLEAHTKQRYFLRRRTTQQVFSYMYLQSLRQDRRRDFKLFQVLNAFPTMDNGYGAPDNRSTWNAVWATQSTIPCSNLLCSTPRHSCGRCWALADLAAAPNPSVISSARTPVTSPGLAAVSILLMIVSWLAFVTWLARWTPE